MDRVAYGSALLKIVVLVQIVFSTWGYLIPPGGFFMQSTYEYSHLILMLFAALSISKPNSSDCILMYLVINMFTILNDIILISLYEPWAYNALERNQYTAASTLNSYRFALGMAIVNLMLKPVICFILYKIYQHRGGDVRAELISIRVVGNGQSYNGYNSFGDNNNVETASPHQSIVEPDPPHSG